MAAATLALRPYAVTHAACRAGGSGGGDGTVAGTGPDVGKACLLTGIVRKKASAQTPASAASPAASAVTPACSHSRRTNACGRQTTRGLVK